jgi:hypothetical protein
MKINEIKDNFDAKLGEPVTVKLPFIWWKIVIEALEFCPDTDEQNIANEIKRQSNMQFDL